MSIQERADIAEYAVAFADKLGFDYCDAFVEGVTGRSYAVEQGKLNGSSYYEKAGIRIRLVKGRRLLTFSTNKFEKAAIASIISGYRGFNGVDTVFSGEKAQRAKYKVGERKRLADADVLADLLSLDKTLAKRKYIKFRSVYAGVGKSDTFFVNSDGSRIESSLPSAQAFASIIVGGGKETRQRSMQFGGIGGYELLDPEKLEEKVLDEAKALLNVIENGMRLSQHELRDVRNVVIAPEISGIAVHESIGHPSEADRVFLREAAQAGTSYLTKDNLGLEIGSPVVTIMDDPTIPNSNGFYLYDDDGVKAGPRTLVRDGVQDELLMNRAYAHFLGKKSNASSRSDYYSNEPLVRMANTYLKPGNATLDELISEACDGVYIKSFMEWNIDDTRSFSRYQGSEAYVIKNHRLGKPVKNYQLETKTIDFWHAVRLVSNEFELFLGNCGKGEPMQGVPVAMGGASALLSFGR
jgi:TldD protein